jgi:hypothetical protein
MKGRIFKTSLFFMIIMLGGCGDHNTVIPEPPEPPVPPDTVPSMPSLAELGCSETLPVLFINTVDSTPIVSKEEYVDAKWWLDSAGIEGVRRWVRHGSR